MNYCAAALRLGPVYRSRVGLNYFFARMSSKFALWKILILVQFVRLVSGKKGNANYSSIYVFFT